MSNFWEKDKPVQADQPPVQKVNFWEKDKPVEQAVPPPVAEVAPVAQPQAKGSNLADLVTNNPFVSQSGEKPIPPLLERPEYKNLWPETSYLRTPEPAYTLDMPDGQEVLISLDGKSMTGAVYNKKDNTFDFEYTEKQDPVVPSGISAGGRGFYSPPTNVTKIQKVDPSKVLGYTNAADKLESAKIAFGRSIIPTASGFTGFAGGAALTTAILGAPETFGASLIPLGVGAITGFGTGLAGQSFQDRMFPLDKAQQLALDSNPKVAGVAGFAPAFIGSPTNPRTWMNLASKTPGVAGKAATQLGSNAVMMGALGTGNDVGANLVAGKPALQGVGLGSILHHTGTGLLLGHPNKIGRAMEAPGRFVANTALMPFGKGEYVAPRSTTLPDLEAAAAEAQAQAQGQGQPAAPQAEAPAPAAPTPAPAPAARPEGSVNPRPRYDETYRGRGKEGIDEYTAAWQAWDAQYGQTHWSDGTPKKPTPAPSATEAPSPAPAANVEAYPAMPDRATSTQAQMDAYLLAGQEWTRKYGQTHNLDGTPKPPKPVAPSAEAPKPPASAAPVAPAPSAPAPSAPAAPAPDTKPAVAEAPKPTGNVFEMGVADLTERIRFIKGELGRRQAEVRAAAEEGRVDPEGQGRVDRLNKSLAEAESALERLKDRNAPRSELPPPAKEPTTAEVLAQKKAEFDKLTRQLEAAHRSQRSMKGGDEQVALLEAEHEVASTAYEEALAAHEQAQRNGGNPPPAAPAPKPVAPKPVTPVAPAPVAPTAAAPAPAPKPAAPASKPKAEPAGVTSAREQLAKLEASGNANGPQAKARRKYIRSWEKANGLPYSVELEAPKPPKPAPTEEPVAQTPVEPVATEPAPATNPSPSAKPARRSITKPDGTIVQEPTGEGRPKNWGRPTHAIVTADGDQVNWVRGTTQNLAKEFGNYEGKSVIHDLATGETIEVGKAKSEAPKESAPAEDFDPVEQPNPKENPKDVAEREALTQQENPADTTEPTAKEVEIQTTKNIIGGLEKQIAASEKAGRGESKQTKKQRSALEVAKKKLAELEGKTEEPVSTAEANSEAPKGNDGTTLYRGTGRNLNYTGVEGATWFGRTKEIAGRYGDVAEHTVDPKAKTLTLHDFGWDKGDPASVEVNKKGANQLIKIAKKHGIELTPEQIEQTTGEELFSKDTKLGRDLTKALKAEGVDVVHTSNIEGEATFVLDPTKVTKVKAPVAEAPKPVEPAPAAEAPAAEAPKPKATDNNAVPETPDSTVESVQRIAGVKLSKGAREELGIRSEEGLQPDFIDEGNIQSLKDHLKDVNERLDSTIDASRNDPYEGPKARKDAKEAKKAVEAAIAKLEAEEAQAPKSETQAEAPKATEPTPTAETPKAEPSKAEAQVESINEKLAELERAKKGDSPEAEALRTQRDKLQATIDAQKPDSPDVRSAAEKWADKTIAEGNKRLNSGLDPELLAAYAVKGAIKFGRTLKDFKEFSREMVNEFGNGIRPHLKAIFDKAQEPGLAKEYADQQQARNAAGRPEPDLAGEAEKMAQLRAEERDNNRELAEGRKPVLSAGGRTWRSAVDSPVVAFFKHIGMRMRTIADNNPQSETAQKIVNDFSLIPGKKETGRDFNTAHTNERTKFFNKFSIALGPVLRDMRRMSAADLVKFNDLFIQALEGRIKVGGETGEAVKRVQQVMDELHAYGKEAGLDMGKVTDYFPRMINAEMVLADRAGFEEAAARAYERQWERLQKEGLETKSVDPETKKPIVTRQDELGFAGETTKRPNFKEMARKWADAIELGQEGFDFERGIFDEGNAATKENFQKNREFTKEEAAEFDAFRQKDFETVLSNHIGAMARRAEVARRLGADGMEWTKIASKLAEEGVSAKDIAQLKNDLQSNLGIGETLLTEAGQDSQNAYNLVSTTAFLKLTGLLNVAEPGSIGIRERDPIQGASAMVSNLFRIRNVLTRMSPGEAKSVKTEIERIYGKGHDLASALAIELGITNIDHGLGSLSSGFHLDVGTDAGGQIRRVNDNVYRMYGIHATEVAKRETSVKHGMRFIDKSIQFFEGNSNLQRIFKAMGKDVDAKTLAKDRIMELGIKESDVPAFMDFAKTLRGMDSNQQLKAIMSDSPMAAEYRKALQIFNKQSSVQATRASRPDIANKHPLGKFLFQFATYTNEWASQHGRYMLETAKKIRNSDGRYNASERLLAAGVVPAFAMATAGMYGIRHIINKLTGFKFEDSETFGVKIPAWVKTIADSVVYTGILGPAEPAYKWLVRDQPPGGVLASWINSSTKAFAQVKENPDSNAAQKNIAKIGYRGGAVPVTNSGLAVASGAADLIPNPVARGAVKLGAAGLAQYVANNQTENAAATAIAGEDKKGTKNPPKPTPPKPPSPPTPR